MKKQSAFWQILSKAHIYGNILEHYIILPYVSIIIHVILLHNYSYRNVCNYIYIALYW
jgi:hypothetical protein